MKAAKFQRARKPEEREIRRRAILQAARAMMDEAGSAELSLSDLARRSGVSKPNIYRYFESREEVLLQVWVEDVRALLGALELSLAKVRRGHTAAVITAIVAAFAAQPRMCELMSIASSVLERNLSTTAIAAAKTTLATLVARISSLVNERLPAIALADCLWASSTAAIYVCGIWAPAHPWPAAAEVMQQPEFALMQVSFERDFTRFLEVTFAGLAREAVAGR